MTLSISDQPLTIAGCRLAAGDAGIRYRGRNDLVLMAFDAGTRMAGVFTRNNFCAAPVIVAREHLQQGSLLAMLINAGNANAGTGSAGLEAARASCQAAAELLSVRAEQVLPFSTGVIGEQLPVDRIRSALPGLVQALNEQGWEQAARAIMTTDTRVKIASLEVSLSDGPVRITGIAKGSGMIHPNMATMLGFVATDASLEQAELAALNREAAEHSFNRISVDGDTSTNDACILAATGASGVGMRHASDRLAFAAALTAVYQDLARKIVLDGEGATKFVTLDVESGASSEECLRVARAVACSPLVKTAWYASDPNWGRILAAVGNAGIQDLQTEQVQIYLDEVCIVKSGGLNPDYREDQGKAVFNKSEFTVRIRLGRGSSREQVWTCDLSHQYVTINAAYRS